MTGQQFAALQGYDEFTYANVCYELDRILEIEGISRAIFIGQSLGGMIAQYYIDQHPTKAIGFVSIDSVPFGDYYSKSDFYPRLYRNNQCTNGEIN